MDSVSFFLPFRLSFFPSFLSSFLSPFLLLILYSSEGSSYQFCDFSSVIRYLERFQICDVSPVASFGFSEVFHACLVLDPIEISNDATIKTSHNWNLSRYRVIREKSQNWWLEPSEEPSSPFLSHLLSLFFIDLHNFFTFPLIFGHSNLFLHFTYVASVWVEMMSKGVGRFHALIIAMLISRLTLGVTAPLLGILSKWLIVGRYKVVRWNIDFLSYFTNLPCAFSLFQSS